MRKLSLVIAGILGAGSPLISQAATLGQAEVQSYLSERLEVRVPLMRSSDEPLDEITVQLAPPSFYREAGVPLASLRGNLTFTIESERGQEYVRIGSKRPIRDPIVSMLLQVQSPQGRMIRSYNLLLDPPSVASRTSPASTSSGTAEPSPSRQASGSVSKPSASSGWQRVEPADNLELSATRKVQRGDTLSEIASDFVDEGQDIRSVMQAIIDANPHAFANGNGNSMMAGAELKVPSTSTASADGGQAGESSATEQPIQRLPALELLSPSEEEPGADSKLGGLGELSRDNPLPAIADSTRAEAEPMDPESALEQEELESVKAENEALTEQLRSLKEQIDSVKVAIDERDAQIAELKDVVEESRQQAQEARANQENFWVQWGKYLTGAMGLLIIALLIALGLRRARRDEEPAVPMPATADATGKEPRPDTPSVGPAAVATGTSAAATGALAGGGQDDQPSIEEPSPSEPGNDDPMNPEMALEEARVLESFNLTQQALELLEESLAEHPRHGGLQAAVNRLSGMEQGAGTGEAAEEPVAEPPQDETSSAATEKEPSRAAAMTDEPADTAAEFTKEGESSEETPAQSGEIAWDDDFDDMLATPENEEAATSDDNLMEFDDSFALETPNEEERPASFDESLDLPNNETPPASVETAEKATSDEPEPLDLDLSGYQAEGSTDETAAGGDEGGLELSMEPEQDVEKAATEGTTPDTATSSGESDADIDTRVSLAEAFLDVGDRESFDMIEAELREEGATAALDRLAELKQRHDS